MATGLVTFGVFVVVGRWYTHLSTPQAVPSIPGVLQSAWRPLHEITSGVGAEWVYVRGSWSRQELRQVLEVARPEVVRFPGGMFANVWSISREEVRADVKVSGGFADRVQSYTRALRASRELLSVTALSRAAREQGFRVLWVVSPFLEPLDDVLVALNETREGDTTLIELGNELYDGWFAKSPLTAVQLVRRRDALALLSETLGRPTKIALPVSVGEIGSRRDTWDQVILDSAAHDAPLAVHLYLGERPALCRECPIHERMHVVLASLLSTTRDRELWITEVNVDVRYDPVKLGTRQVRIGSDQHGLALASTVLHLAAMPRVRLLTIHALVGSGNYGLVAQQEDGGFEATPAAGPALAALELIASSTAIREVRGERGDVELFEVCGGGVSWLMTIDWLSGDLRTDSLSTRPDAAGCPVPTDE